MSGIRTAADEVVDALERSPVIIIPLVLEVPECNRKRRTPEGKWSAHEHAAHLSAVHPLFVTRLERMLEEDKPVLKPYDPKLDDADDALLQVDLMEALDRFRADRSALVQRLRLLAPDQWHREAVHPEYSPYTVLNMFRHLALHDFLHAYRIEKLALKPSWAE